jgi:hypothetical protein
MITGSSSLSDCRNCGRMLRGAKEIDYCEKCMIAYEMGRQSEMQKQRQEEIGFLENIKKLICKVTPEMQLDNEILKEICPEIFYNCENRLEQLNQPKTED